MSDIRVAQVVTTLDLGGAQLAAMDLASRLPDFGYETWCVAGAEGELRSEAWASGDGRFRVLRRLRRRLSPLSDAIALWQLYRFFRQNDIRIVHTHSSKAGVLGRLAARLAGVPLVFHTVHGWSFHRGQGAIARRLAAAAERVAAGWTTRLVAVADACVEQGLAAGIGARGDYARIYCGAERGAVAGEHSTAAVRRTFGLPEACPLVVSVACLKRQKAPLDFVAAARAIRDRVPDACFLLVGDGALRRDVLRRVSKLGLQQVVRVLGWRRDVPAILGAADVFLLTSRWEGLPLAVVEAMLAGTPVVATAVDGTPEAVANGRTGYLVPPGDPDAAAERVAHLLRHPDAAARMGRAGRARARRAFRRDAMLEETDALYRACLRERREKYHADGMWEKT
jgi:glycosyltransferase involved in cell wall biosynthesis